MKIKKIIWPVISIIIILAFGYIIYQNFAEFSKILDYPWIILILVLLSSIGFFFNGMKIKFLVKNFGVDLGVMESYWLSVVTSLGNYLTPFRGGAALRAYYLKKKYQFSYIDFFVTMAGTYVIILFVTAILGLICLLVMYLLNIPTPKEFIILFLGILVLTILVLFVKIPHKINSSNFILRKISKVIKGWNLIKKDKKLILKVGLMDTFCYVIVILKVYILFEVLDQGISFISSTLLGLIHGISTLITITPAALGIREVAIAYSAELLGIGLNVGAVVSIIDRVILILTLLLLGLIFGKKYVVKKNSVVP
ncbi:MAG: lysylphosphatidylglycerol synthase transmembrane domain-containing protein [archaeon]